jgi:hypothetical protein
MLVGAGIGAGAGTVHWMAHKRNSDLPKDSRVVFSLSEPMPISNFENASVTPLATPAQWQHAVETPSSTSAPIAQGPTVVDIATTPY